MWHSVLCYLLPMRTTVNILRIGCFFNTLPTEQCLFVYRCMFGLASYWCMNLLCLTSQIYVCMCVSLLAQFLCGLSQGPAGHTELGCHFLAEEMPRPSLSHQQKRPQWAESLSRPTHAQRNAQDETVPGGTDKTRSWNVTHTAYL